MVAFQSSLCVGLCSSSLYNQDTSLTPRSKSKCLFVVRIRPLYRWLVCHSTDPPTLCFLFSPFQINDQVPGWSHSVEESKTPWRLVRIWNYIPRDWVTGLSSCYGLRSMQAPFFKTQSLKDWIPISPFPRDKQHQHDCILVVNDRGETQVPVLLT